VVCSNDPAKAMTAGGMHLGQFCLLATALSLLVYYLTVDTLCGSSPALQASEDLGKRLKPSSGKQHVLVTGGAGYIGSHAALRLLRDGHAVTVLDNLSRGNPGAVEVLAQQAPAGQFQFVEADLGHSDVVKQVFQRCQFDTVMHFAAVAYVGASPEQPCMISAAGHHRHPQVRVSGGLCGCCVP
jgi:UDP-arabinose 4-epimerase